MIKTKSIIFFLILQIIWSCDPMRRIDMINHSKFNASITWTIKADSILTSPFFLSNSTQLKFELQPYKPYNIIRMSFGTRTWTVSEVKRLASGLDSVTIQMKNGFIAFGKEKEIEKFLLAKRKGVLKRKIVINMGH